MPAHPIPGGCGLPNTPQGRKALAFVPQIVAAPDEWSATRFAKEAGLNRSTAAKYLAAIASNLAQESSETVRDLQSDALQVASRVRDRQVARAERIEQAIDAALADLGKGFLKVRFDGGKDGSGEWEEKRYDYDAAGQAKILLDVLRSDETLNRILRSLSGRELAEKVLLAKVKGDAIGAGIGRELVDYTARSLDDDLFIEIEGMEISDEDPVLIADQQGESLFSPVES